MDLGCIDMGCVEKQKRETSVEKENSPKESVTSASKLGKNNKAKDAVRSSLSALNKLTSQISKPPHRKTSPLNWFPRKKVEPYLKRKIKMLQEVDGMCSTLDETLGDSNPHYCRVLREKMAIREAAEKAIEARKAAMVEASWCRILQAARIESKEAEAQLSKAELSAADALEAARAVGVIMTDIPESTHNNNYKIETVSAKEGSATHTISATFETAFEVDKQVAAAVKSAFSKLANCPSISRDEFKELLRKISENPDTDDKYNYLSGECESDDVAELEKEVSCSNEEEFGGVRLRKKDKRQETDNKFNNTGNIVDMMLDRLQCLKEEELASLATIVATSGLNAALSETVENGENCLKASSRVSIGGRGSTEVVQLPSLDKFLVRRLTRLEREVLEAKNAARKNETSDGGNIDNTSSRTELKIEEGVPDLGSVLVKHSSKLEKEVEEARMNNGGGRRLSEIDNKKCQRTGKKDEENIPSLDKFLVKKLTRLEREVQEAKEGKKSELIIEGDNSKGKENMDMNEIKNQRNTSTYSSLENASLKKNGYGDYESLDKVLVKHVSRLEKEKLEFSEMRIKPKQKGGGPETSEASLDQVLVKHKSRLEREKTVVADQQEDGNNRHSVSRRQARERELQDAWGGLSLGNSIRPHVSRLQRDKAAWLKAEEDERKRDIDEAV